MKRILEPEVMESNQEAISFDSYQKNTMKRWWPFLEKKLKKLRILKGSKILDVVAGPANFSIRLAKKYKTRVWATDLSNEMLKIARYNIKKSKINKYVSLLKDDAKKMRFRDNSFDFVFCRYTLHQIPHPEKVVNEILRVAKKGGKIFILDAVRPRSKKELEKRVKSSEKGYKKSKIKGWETLLKNSKESALSSLSKKEIENLFRASKIKKYKLKFQDFLNKKGRPRLFILIGEKT